MLNENQLSVGVDALHGLAVVSVADHDGSSPTSNNALEAFLAEMQASMNACGQYDLSPTGPDSAAS